MHEGTCRVAPSKPFATPMTPPTNPALSRHVFLELWTVKHAVEDRGDGIGEPLCIVGHRVVIVPRGRLCEEERTILGNGGREDAGGGVGMNVNMTGGWHWSGCCGRRMTINGGGGGNTNGHALPGGGAALPLC